MREITGRLHERRQIELAKSILESAGYKVEKVSESGGTESTDYEDMMNNRKAFNIPKEDFRNFTKYLKDKGYTKDERRKDMYIHPSGDRVYVDKTWYGNYHVEPYKSKGKRVNEAGGDTAIWSVSIDLATNNRYPVTNKRVPSYGPIGKTGKEILAQVGYSDANVDVDALGYSDITFVFNDATYEEVVDFSRLLVQEVEPAEDPDFEGASAMIVGPYDNDELEPGNANIYLVYKNGSVK